MEKETLYNFFEGKASSKEKEEIRRWQKACSEHENELFEERMLFDMLILSTPKKLIDESNTKHTRYRKFFFEMLKIAAVFAITISGGIYFFNELDTGKFTQTANIVTVPAGQRANITLPDGTNVWLNAHTNISYPAVFSDKKREIRLDGEAYFEVTHSGKPFIVRTKQCNIEVLGTKFNVEAYSDSEDFCTSLLEGSVRISDRKNPEQTVLLIPNHKVSLQNGQLSLSPITDFDRFRWKEGLLCFRNIHFEELMSRFEKCYDIKIVVQNKQLSNYVCSGKFRISDGIDNALRILQKDAKYTFEREQEASVIYIK